MIFVVGSGRTGTHFLTRALLQNPEIVDPFNGRENKALFKSNTMAAFENRKTPPAGARLFYKVAERIRRKQFIDQTHPNLFFGDWILQELPSAKMLFPIRDTRQTVASMIAHPSVSGWYQRLEEFPFPNQAFGLLARSELDQMSITEKCALRVVTTRNYGYKLAERASGRLMTVDYDRLVTDEETVLSEVFDFVGVSRKDNLSGTAKPSSLTKWQEQLSNRQLEEIQRIEDRYLDR